MIKQSVVLLPALLLVAGCGGGTPVALVSNCNSNGACGHTPAPSAAAPELLFAGSAPVSYSTIGGAQQLTESPDGELYRAGQLPLSGKGVTVDYDPRNAVFNVDISVENIDANVRFQDPAHRTDFEPGRTPQEGVPDISTLSYLQAGTPEEVHTFFYETPGVRTKYVTLAGYVRNQNDSGSDEFTRTRGVAVFGNMSRDIDVPNKGSATYNGSLLATLVSIDKDTSSLRSRFEWVSGTASLAVDFGKDKLNASFQGTVVESGEKFEGMGGPMIAPHAGASFQASGTANFDSTGIGYAGKINSASFAGVPINMAASSLDGAFFGKDAAETAGAFRIVGSTPNTRMDFIGAFTGVK